MTYKEYRQQWKSPRYISRRWSCVHPGCWRRGYYEVGDMRCWGAACEKHAKIKEKFDKGIKPPKASDWYKPYNKPYWEI